MPTLKTQIPPHPPQPVTNSRVQTCSVHVCRHAACMCTHTTPSTSLFALREGRAVLGCWVYSLSYPQHRQASTGGCSLNTGQKSQGTKPSTQGTEAPGRLALTPQQSRHSRHGAGLGPFSPCSSAPPPQEALPDRLTTTASSPLTPSPAPRARGLCQGLTYPPAP